MKKVNKNLLYGAFILLTLALVLFIGAQNGDFPASMRAIARIPPGYALLGAACMFASIFMQCLSLASALNTLGYRPPIRSLWVVSLLGEFYCYITPGASGGQPMQLFMLHQRRVPVGEGTAALTIQYQAFEIVLLVCDVVLFVLYRDFITARLGANLPFLIVGWVMNAALVGLTLLVTFYQRPIRWLLSKITALARRFRIGNPDRIGTALDGLAEGYYASMRRLAADRWELLRQGALAFIRLTLIMSVMLCVYRGLGLREASPGKLYAMGCMQYTSAAYLPMPGASGAMEGVFSLYYEGLLPGELLLSGLLAWRFITYYMILIVGFFLAMATGVGRNTKSGD